MAASARSRAPERLDIPANYRCVAHLTPHAQPFTLEAAQLSPRAHPHVCSGQPKHPCITSHTHSAQPGPLPVPSMRTHVTHVACAQRVHSPRWLCTVPGPGWRLRGFEETVFGSTSTCLVNGGLLVNSSRCRLVREYFTLLLLGVSRLALDARLFSLHASQAP
eukprot:scaffold59422_cov57-Phaeocystis_antarctica.AAC.3